MGRAAEGLGGEASGEAEIAPWLPREPRRCRPSVLVCGLSAIGPLWILERILASSSPSFASSPSSLSDRRKTVCLGSP